jgi:hypothetical protein
MQLRLHHMATGVQPSGSTLHGRMAFVVCQASSAKPPAGGYPTTVMHCVKCLAALVFNVQQLLFRVEVHGGMEWWW